MSRTHTTAVRILQVLAPLTGGLSTGSVLASVPTGTLTMPAGTLLVPVVGGQLDHQRMARVVADTALTSAPAAVALESVVGGLTQSFTPTAWRFLGEPPGDATLAVSGGMAGATDGPIKQAVIWERIGTASAAADLFKGKVGRYPAIVLAWDGSTDTKKPGPGRIIHRDRWVAYLIVTRHDSHEARTYDGLDLLDAIEELLADATHTPSGERVSAPEGVMPGDRARVQVPQLSTVHLYTMTFSSLLAVRRRSSAVATDWLSTSLTATTEARTASPDPDDGVEIVDDARFKQDGTP